MKITEKQLQTLKALTDELIGQLGHGRDLTSEQIGTCIAVQHAIAEVWTQKPEKYDIVSLCTYSTEFLHVPGMVRYAMHAFKTGDRKVAVELMDGILNKMVSEEGVLAILSGFVPLELGKDMVDMHIPSYWLKEEAHEA